MKAAFPLIRTLLVLSTCSLSLFSQAGGQSLTDNPSANSPSLSSKLSEPGLVRITQRYDLRRYLNNSYKGIYYGYSLGTWKISAAGLSGSRTVKAHYYLGGESGTDLTVSEKKIQDQFDTSFNLLPDGSIN